ETVEWNELLNRFPKDRKDVYFTPEYNFLYEDYGDGLAFCFAYTEDNNIALYPFLKNSINELGYELDKEYFDIQGAYGYNGLISNTDNSGFLARFWNKFDEWCKDNNIVAEFMRFHPVMKNYELAKEHFNMIYDRHTVYLDLTQSEEDIFAGFDKGTRQHVRKAAKTIEIRPVQYSEENVEVFNRIYRENMEHVNSIPYLFFNKEHFRRMFQQKNIEFFIAYQGNIPIACYSGLVSEEYYGNYLRASLTEYNRTGVNTLMYWSMIKSAKAHGCHYVHFGGGTSGDPENSLLHYKMNFSKTLSDFYIGKKVHNQVIYNEIVKQWKEKHPESYAEHKVMLLGYREI
nr:GNAT family N-acetyltransferase [Butyrivibrio sp.]